jgi:hypothetical protein
MSGQSARDLAVAYDRCDRVNQEVLCHLEAGGALEGLTGLFKAKQEALKALQAPLQALVASPGQDLSAVHAAQARAARSEAQLSEALGKLQRSVKNVSAVTKAYGSKLVDKLGTKNLDLES